MNYKNTLQGALFSRRQLKITWISEPRLWISCEPPQRWKVPPLIEKTPLWRWPNRGGMLKKQVPCYMTGEKTPLWRWPNRGGMLKEKRIT